MATRKRPSRRRTFGSLRKLTSGRWQARYSAPPNGSIKTAPHTFQTKTDAETWLTVTEASIHMAHLRGERWQSPEDVQAAQHREQAAAMTFQTYAGPWLADRDVKPTTRALYESLLRVHILPTFGDLPLTDIDPVQVRAWHAGLDTGPTGKANAYGLLRTIMGDAVEDGLLPANPVRVKRAGSKKRARELKVLTLDEFQALVDAIPPRYRALVLLGGWCALRFGELAALRRSDLDLKNGLVHVRQAVTTIKGQTIVGAPKADSRRAVTIPPHIVQALREHVLQHAGPGRDGLVFPSASGNGYLALSTLHRVWGPAKAKAGRPDLRVHDLRHYGLVMAARAGATLGELQQRAGHSTAQAAMIYQSSVSERPAEIAARLSAMVDQA